MTLSSYLGVMRMYNGFETCHSRPCYFRHKKEGSVQVYRMIFGQGINKLWRAVLAFKATFWTAKRGSCHSQWYLDPSHRLWKENSYFCYANLFSCQMHCDKNMGIIAWKIPFLCKGKVLSSCRQRSDVSNRYMTILRVAFKFAASTIKVKAFFNFSPKVINIKSYKQQIPLIIDLKPPASPRL